MSKHNPYIFTIASLALFFTLIGMYLSLPFSQSLRDTLQCDALCYGYFLSIKSLFSLISAFIIGILSDRYGRISMLYFGLMGSLFSYIMSLYISSIWMLFAAIFPLTWNQSPALFKALFSDYIYVWNISEDDKTAYMGYLGMAAGLSFMLGPVIGAAVFESYESSMLGSILCACIFGGLLLLLPHSVAPQRRTSNIVSDASVNARKRLGTSDSDSYSIFSLQNAICRLLSVHSRGACILVFMRLSMGLAYSIYNTSFTVSLKHNHGFTPRDYSLYMGWVGLSYSLSQGFLSKHIIRAYGTNRTGLLLFCCCVLGGGRVVAMQTSSVVLLYSVMFAVITALSVVNTLMAATCSTIAAIDGSAGGLYGTMEGVEKLAGILGPTLGGLLHSYHPLLPATSILVIYSIIFSLLYFQYDEYVINAYSIDNPVSSSGLDAQSCDVHSKGTSCESDAIKRIKKHSQ